MPHDLLPASGYDRLLSRLRAGQPVETSRAVLEACFGLWNTEPELCEDGRATRLCLLPPHGALFLTRDGELLAVHQTERRDHLRSRLFTGTPEAIWRAFADHHPGMAPGCSALPRYWVLRENVSPTAAIYGIYDLLHFQVVAREADCDLITARVAVLNSVPGLVAQAA